MLKKVIKFINFFGFYPRKLFTNISGIPSYLADLKELLQQKKKSDNSFPISSIYPCLSDRFSNSGSARGHYFYQDLLVAQRIFNNNPQLHVDIGSRIDGFVSHVASFREIEIFDIRPLENIIDNVNFQKMDLMRDLNKDWENYCDSVSCLHTIEHFGLGRYGDKVNFLGYLKGLENIKQILKQGGKFYFSVPIGPQRIEFNAHRVFSVSYLLEILELDYKIDQFSYVNDDGYLMKDVPLKKKEIECNYGCKYGCGIFELTKL